MKWRCALIQRWLPDYPDGDLSPFRRRRLEAHLRVCPDCQKEWAELQEVARIYQEHPLPVPGPNFWEAFNRELHLKLAGLNHGTAPERRRLKAAYWLGAPAVAVLLLFLSHYLVTLLPQGKAPQLAESQKREQFLETGREPELAKERQSLPSAPEMGQFREADARQVLMIPPQASDGHGVVPEQVIYAGLNDGVWQEEAPSWDVEAVVADLSPQERKILVENLTSRR
jgi:anti-sigma factor RsiW